MPDRLTGRPASILRGVQLASIVALAIVPVSVSAQEIVELDLVGDINRPQAQAITTLACPSGMFIEGMVVRQGEWLDGVQLRCARVNQYGRIVSRGFLSQTAGGSGGSHEASLRCPTRSLVSKIGGSMAQVSRGLPGILNGGIYLYLADPVLYCTLSPLPGRPRPEGGPSAANNPNDGKLNQSLSIGDSLGGGNSLANGLMFVDGARDQLFRRSPEIRYDESIAQSCPAGYAALSIRVSLDLQWRTIKAIGLNCAEVPHEVPPPLGSIAGERTVTPPAVPDTLPPLNEPTVSGTATPQPPAPPAQGICSRRPSACNRPPVGPIKPPIIPNQPTG